MANTKKAAQPRSVLPSDKDIGLSIIEAHDMLLLNFYLSISTAQIREWIKKYKLGLSKGNHKGSRYISKEKFIKFLYTHMKGFDDAKIEVVEETVKKTRFSRSEALTRKKERTIKKPTIK